MKPQSPCKDCSERHPGCHDRCEGYQEYKKEQFDYNTQIVKMKQSNSYFNDRMFKCASRYKHKK